MNRSSLGAALVVLSVSMGSLTGCIQNDVQLGSGDPEGVGDWVGYVENHTFVSGSDSVVVHITGLSGDAATGTVRVGDQPDLASPTDPDVGYPPDIYWGEITRNSPGREPHEGFDYTLEEGSLTSTRLKGVFYGTEVWAAWCEMQTSYSYKDGSGPYFCVPNGKQTWSDSGCAIDDVAFDCGKMSLCQPIGVNLVCNCDADGCQLMKPKGRIELDLKVEGDKAHGSIVGLPGGEKNVWLTRSASH